MVRVHSCLPNFYHRTAYTLNILWVYCPVFGYSACRVSVMINASHLDQGFTVATENVIETFLDDSPLFADLCERITVHNSTYPKVAGQCKYKQLCI